MTDTCNTASLVTVAVCSVEQLMVAAVTDPHSRAEGEGVREGRGLSSHHQLLKDFHQLKKK